MYRVGVVVGPCRCVGALEKGVELGCRVFSGLGCVERCGGKLLYGRCRRLDGLYAEKGFESPRNSLLDFVSGLAAGVAHVVESLLRVTCAVLEGVRAVGCVDDGLGELVFYGLYRVLKGVPYGLGSLGNIVLEAGELLLCEADGPGDACLEALGERLAVLDACGHCLLKGRAEAVGLCSHLSELVADVVSGLLKPLAHVLRCRADVTGCGGSRCAHAAHRLAAILCADLRTVGCVVDAAEDLLELFDGVNGIFGIETDSVCELSRVCQNTTSLYDEIAAPGRAAISYLGSIRLAT